MSAFVYTKILKRERDACVEEKENERQRQAQKKERERERDGDSNSDSYIVSMALFIG